MSGFASVKYSNKFVHSCPALLVSHEMMAIKALPKTHDLMQNYIIQVGWTLSQGTLVTFWLPRRHTTLLGWGVLSNIVNQMGCEPFLPSLWRDVWVSVPPDRKLCVVLHCSLPGPLSVRCVFLRVRCVFLSAPTAPLASLTSLASDEAALTTAPIKQRPLNTASPTYPPLPPRELSPRIRARLHSLSSVYSVCTVGCITIKPSTFHSIPPPSLPNYHIVPHCTSI